MRIRIVTLKFNSVTEQFDDTELLEFIKDKELLSVQEHFFIKYETPYLVVFMTYLPGTHDIEKSARKKEESWRELLSDDQLPLFNTLRDWRSERAKQEGMPPYIICNNRQLAQLVATRPTTLAGLANVHGIGKAKVEKYGKELLAMLTPEAPKDDSEKQDRSTGQQKTLFREESSSQERSSRETSRSTEQQPSTGTTDTS